MFVKNDGTIQWTCSAKCKKNHEGIEERPTKMKWTRKHVKGGIKVKK